MGTRSRYVAAISVVLASATALAARPTTGQILTVAGGGVTPADGVLAIEAALDHPVALATWNDTLYLAEAEGHRVRRVHPADAHDPSAPSTGTILTVAGTGERGDSGDGGPARAARIAAPSGIATDAQGNLYVADTANHRVRKISTGTDGEVDGEQDESIISIAGNGLPGYEGDGGAATAARLFSPRGLAFNQGNLYIADSENSSVRMVTPGTDGSFDGATDPEETITTVAGNGQRGFGGDGGPATGARIYHPVGVSFDASGRLALSDPGSYRVREVVPGADGTVDGDADDIISTIAGNGIPAFLGDGVSAVATGLRDPNGIAHDSAGNLYISDPGVDRVRKLEEDTGLLWTTAGRGTTGDSGDGGSALSAELDGPAGLAVHENGDLYLSDARNNRVRVVGGVADYNGSTGPQGSPAGETQRVSVSTSGSDGNSESFAGVISANSRYVAFDSLASNLVPGDLNRRSDIFVRDLRNGFTALESTPLPGSPSTGADGSTRPSISGNGRFIAFTSDETALVPGDTNEFCGPALSNCADIFVKDRATGATTRVSESSTGEQANGPSSAPVISGDGRYVAFSSGASNLVPGDTNGVLDVFVHDTSTGETTRISVSSSGGEANKESLGPFISSRGRFVGFSSAATNIAPATHTCPALSPCQDVYLHDRLTAATERVSVRNSGGTGNETSGGGSVSADGRFVAFGSHATNLVAGDDNTFCFVDWKGPQHDENCEDVFVRDRLRQQTVRVSVDSAGREANGASTGPVITPDGRYVAFMSTAQNLSSSDLRGDPTNEVFAPDANFERDVYVHDRVGGITTRESVATPSGLDYAPAPHVEGPFFRLLLEGSSGRSIASDGKIVVFDTRSGTMVIGDSNGDSDIFIRRRGLALDAIR